MNEGTIFTFYSYKGGVGRTFALANIGALLSLWGYKTLCVDWDLEAPGLHLYFQQWMKGENHRGLTEMIWDHADGKSPRWKDYVTEVYFPEAKQPLLLMSAGLQDTTYVQRMQALNWANLYENYSLGSFLEEIREDWKKTLDFVLIDSRTGITDIGGICTVQFPDILAVLFTANNQSLYGSIDVVERARRARAHLPVDRAKILVLPIAARFEGRVEFKLAEDWLKTFEKELVSYYAEWSHRETTISDLLNFTRLPYVPYWSFGEKLPVIEKGTKDPDDIGFPLEALAALVAQRLSHSDVLVRNRDTYVISAKKEPISSVLSQEEGKTIVPIRPVQVFISYSQEDKNLCNELEKHLLSLKRQGWLTDWYDSSIEPGSNWRKEIGRHLEEADIILLLVSADFMASDFLYSAEMIRTLERHDAGQASIIPIILRPTFWESSPIEKLEVLPTDGRAITSSSWYSFDEAFTDVVLGIRKVIEALGTKKRPLAPPKKIWKIPYPRNPLFTGREDLLARLAQALRPSQATALSQAYAISGLGGIGKTQLALEYAYQHRADYQAVFWVRADTRENLVADFVVIARELQLPEQDARDVQQTVTAVQAWLSTHGDWLLILDSADDLMLASEFLPSSYGGQVLLTTRAQAMGRLAQRIEVDTMFSEVGTLFLLRRAGLLAPDAQLEQSSVQEREQAEELVRELGGLPLALDQAGAYMEETSYSIAQYLQLYRSRRALLLTRRGGLVNDHPAPVAATWSLSFAAVEQADPAAADLLRVCAFLHPDVIPEDLLRQGLASLEPPLQALGTDELAFQEAVSTLGAYSLLRRNRTLQTLSIHRLVQVVLIDTLAQEQRQAWVERTTHLLWAARPEINEVTFPHWEEWERLLPHALTWAAHLQQTPSASSEAAELLHLIGWYLTERAQYAEAGPLLQQALALSEQVQGKEHPATAAALATLGWLYREQGRYEEAEPLLQRALAISEQVLGPEHPSTASTLNNLGVLYRNQGKYEQAAPLFQRALAIYEQALGPDHPDTAAILNNLAVLYRVQGRYEEAEPLLQRALAIKERALPPDHPSTATTLNNLAQLYQAQGRYEEAEPLFQRAIAIDEKTLGPEHPDLATMIENYASLLHTMHRPSEALPLEHRARAIRAKQQPS